MLCTVARAALPREYAEVPPLPPSVRTEPFSPRIFLFSLPVLRPNALQAACPAHTSSEGEVAVAVPPLPVLTSSPWGWRCQSWRGAGLAACSALLGSQQRKARRVWSPLIGILTGCSPPGDRSGRSTWETRPRSGTGVGLAVSVIFHSSGTFWGRITFNELMLTHEVPDTLAPRQSHHPSLLQGSVRCDTTASWTSSSLFHVEISGSWRIPSPCAHKLLCSSTQALQDTGKWL